MSRLPGVPSIDAQMTPPCRSLAYGVKTVLSSSRVSDFPHLVSNRPVLDDLALYWMLMLHLKEMTLELVLVEFRAQILDL